MKTIHLQSVQIKWTHADNVIENTEDCLFCTFLCLALFGFNFLLAVLTHIFHFSAKDCNNYFILAIINMESLSTYKSNSVMLSPAYLPFC